MFCQCYCFLSRPSHSTTDGQIATRIVLLTPSITKFLRAKNSVNFDSVIPEILWLICMGGDCREANKCTVLVKGYPLGGNSIATL